MDEAREFVSSLPEKAQKKITYNLLKVEGGGKWIVNSSRNWRTPRYGSFGRSLMGYVTACLPFGIRK